MSDPHSVDLITTVTTQQIKDCVGWDARDKLYKLVPDSNSVAEVVAINGRELLMTGALYVVETLRLYRFQSIISTTRPFSDYFKGFDKVEAVRRIFGDKTEQVLRDLKVEFLWAGGYMGVNGSNGHLIASPRYLNEGDKTDIYLDVIHELVHVKQFMEGKDLFDTHYSYTERPTEIEAYRYAVEEARRLGLSEARICEYLKTKWMSEKELKQLASTVDVHCKQMKKLWWLVGKNSTPTKKNDALRKCYNLTSPQTLLIL